MTDKEKIDVLASLEKTFFKSKKFIAWFITQLFLGVLAGMALYFQENLGWPLSTFMTSIVIVMGSTTMWIIGKQAAVDSLTRKLINPKKEGEGTTSPS